MARGRRQGISDVRKALILRAIEALPAGSTPQDISQMTVLIVGYDIEGGLSKLQRGISAGTINKAIFEDPDLLAMAQSGRIAVKLRTAKSKDPEWVSRVDAKVLVRNAPGSAIEAGRALFMRNIDDIQDPKIRAARIKMVEGLIAGLTATPLTRGIHAVKLNSDQTAMAVNNDRLSLVVTKQDRQIQAMLASNETTQRLLVASGFMRDDAPAPSRRGKQSPAANDEQPLTH